MPASRPSKEIFVKAKMIGAIAALAVLGTGAGALAQQETAPGTAGASRDYYGGYYGGGSGGGPGGGGGGVGGGAGSTCNPTTAIRSATIEKRSRGLRLTFRRARPVPIDIDVYRIARGSSPDAITKQSLVARFNDRRGSFNWSGKANREGRKVVDGIYVVRYLMRTNDGTPVDLQRMALRRSKGKFYKWPGYFHRRLCQTISSFELGRPVFGGKGNRGLSIRYRLNAPARVTLRLLRNESTVRTLTRNQLVQSTDMQTINFRPGDLARGTYRVVLTVTANNRTETVVLKARRL